MVNRGGGVCLAAFPQEPVPVDLADLVRNNIHVFGIRGDMARANDALSGSGRRDSRRLA